MSESFRCSLFHHGDVIEEEIGYRICGVRFKFDGRFSEYSGPVRRHRSRYFLPAGTNCLPIGVLPCLGAVRNSSQRKSYTGGCRVIEKARSSVRRVRFQYMGEIVCWSITGRSTIRYRQ